jgi:hypothetical protein
LTPKIPIHEVPMWGFPEIHINKSPLFKKFTEKVTSAFFKENPLFIY